MNPKTKIVQFAIFKDVSIIPYTDYYDIVELWYSETEIHNFARQEFLRRFRYKS